MSIEESSCQIKILSTLADITPDDWNHCAKGASGFYNPFLSYSFLRALELSGSVGEKAGWIPHYFILQDENTQILGTAPAYLKTHSYGEYVFDHAWADAYHRFGLNYYPKLQVSIPFTPVTGPRLLIPNCSEAQKYQKLLLDALITYVETNQLSSCHFTFVTEPEWNWLETEGLLKRKDQQFHWKNNEYPSFDAFLDTLSSRKRKSIKKERTEAVSQNIEIRHISGSDITEELWDVFFEFYMDTGSRKWGTPYLSRKFFSLLSEMMPDDILLILGYRDKRPIAGALNFIGDHGLYGRYWGAVEDHKFLHFEICYYQAIEYAIANGLCRVEAGAQGPHKLARGYLPETTYSSHYISNPRLRLAIDHYLKQEAAHIDLEQMVLKEMSPYAKK